MQSQHNRSAKRLNQYLARIWFQARALIWEGPDQGTARLGAWLCWTLSLCLAEKVEEMHRKVGG